jgi:hypothetical protein
MRCAQGNMYAGECVAMHSRYGGKVGIGGRLDCLRGGVGREEGEERMDVG